MLRGPRRTRIHRPVIPVQRGGIILDLSLRVLRGHLNASALQLCAVFVLCFVAACAPRVERGQAAVAMPDAFSADVAEQVFLDPVGTPLAKRVAARLRTGMVHINGASLDSAAPFGGYKQSGNGREWGAYGIEEYLEIKSVYGAAA